MTTFGPIAVQHGVDITLRDGTRLVCDLWNADLQAPRPVVLERTPYGRGRTGQAERRAGDPVPQDREQVAARYAAAGFAYVVQDCRGTGASGGQFDKYLQEQADSTDTIRWLRHQRWCDGRVAMAGFSYSAACQLAAMAEGGTAPDAAVLDCGGFSDALTSGIRQGGAFALKQATWAHAQAQRDAVMRDDAAALASLSAEDLLGWLRRGPWVPDHSPLAAAPEHEANLAALWQQSLDGPFWDRPGLRTPPGPLAEVPTRALFVTSWHDTSLRGTLENFTAMSALGARCPAPVLIVGPWCHGDRWSCVAGEVDFGIDALPENAFGMSFPELRCRFLAATMGMAPAPLFPGSVHWFELGGRGEHGGGSGTARLKLGGRWRRAASWPPEEAQQRCFVLSEDSLIEGAPAATTRCIVSDPEDPVPTLGGAINSGGTVMPGGMWDQSLLDGRADILRFQTAPLAQALVLAGPVRAEVQVAADAPDFDIAAKLLLVLEDGTALNLSDGICRARHRAGLIREHFVPPGEIVTLPVEMNPVAVRLLPGQRLRLDLSGSNFPCFDMNPQTGGPQGIPGLRRTARITMHSTTARPSRLCLTVLPQ